jgi:hypothetical protein
LDDSIQHAVSHLENATGQLSSIAYINPALPNAQLTAPLPVFDAQASVILEAFIVATPSVEEEEVGKHVILMDKNPADLSSGHVTSQSWAFTDGSTLTIVGIIPTSVNTHLHA